MKKDNKEEELSRLRSENRRLKALLNRIHKTAGEFRDEKAAFTPDVPFEAIKTLWNIMANEQGLPLVMKITTAMKGQIRQRHIDLARDMNRWHNFFQYISKNDFLAGRAPPGRDRSSPFRATLLWVTKETNFQKIAAKEFDQ